MATRIRQGETVGQVIERLTKSRDIADLRTVQLAEQLSQTKDLDTIDEIANEIRQHRSRSYDLTNRINELEQARDLERFVERATGN